MIIESMNVNETKKVNAARKSMCIGQTAEQISQSEKNSDFSSYILRAQKLQF